MEFKLPEIKSDIMDWYLMKMPNGQMIQVAPEHMPIYKELESHFLNGTPTSLPAEYVERMRKVMTE